MKIQDKIYLGAMLCMFAGIICPLFTPFGGPKPTDSIYQQMQNAIIDSAGFILRLTSVSCLLGSWLAKHWGETMAIVIKK